MDRCPRCLLKDTRINSYLGVFKEIKRVNKKTPLREFLLCDRLC